MARVYQAFMEAHATFIGTVTKYCGDKGESAGDEAGEKGKEENNEPLSSARADLTARLTIE